MTIWSTIPTSVLPVLIEASIRSIVLALLIGSLLTALRVKSSTSRLLAWTILLYGALLMPGLDRLAPKILVEIGRIDIPQRIRTIPANQFEMWCRDPCLHRRRRLRQGSSNLTFRFRTGSVGGNGALCPMD